MTFKIFHFLEMMLACLWGVPSNTDNRQIIRYIYCGATTYILLSRTPRVGDNTGSPRSSRSSRYVLQRGSSETTTLQPHSWTLHIIFLLDFTKKLKVRKEIVLCLLMCAVQGSIAILRDSGSTWWHIVN